MCVPHKDFGENGVVTLPENHGTETEHHHVSQSGNLQYQRIDAEDLGLLIMGLKQFQIDRQLEIVRPELQPGSV